MGTHDHYDYNCPDSGEGIQCKGRPEGSPVIKKGLSMSELWAKIHLANFNTRVLAVGERTGELTRKIAEYPAKPNDFSFAQLEYSISDGHEIMLRVKFPLSNVTLDYNPTLGVSLPRRYLDEIGNANEEEGQLRLKQSRRPRDRPRGAHPSITNIEEVYQPLPITPQEEEVAHTLEKPPITLEERISAQDEINALRERIQRELDQPKKGQ